MTIDPDLDFHAALLEAIDNKRISALYPTLWGEVRRRMSPAQPMERLGTAYDRS